jgi:23S rRNA (cytosine1962-C5)-methyltransferase
MESLATIPPISDKRIAIRVKPAAERALRRGHPWIFDHSIRRQSHEGMSGDLAVVFDAKDRFLAIGFYDPDSPIRVRILQHNQPATIDGNWFRTRLARAFEKRRHFLGTDTTGYRLVHGENDGLPGFVLDRYADSGVVRLDTTAWLPHLDLILTRTLELLPLQRLVLRLSRKIQALPTSLFGLQDGQLLFGTMPEQALIFSENGLKFEADLVYGQKTGFFLDQRENRSTLENMMKDDGRLKSVLNVFAYSGGFSVYAARARAEQVTNIDSSQEALAAAVRNLNLNQDQWGATAVKNESIRGDAFTVLDEMSRSNRRFDVVVIDPPSFAKSTQQVRRAERAYLKLTSSGLSLLNSRGLMVMSSCSSRIDATTFFNLVNKAANESGRPLKEIARTSHPSDHPIGFPEGAYLKCLFARAR